MYLGRWPGSPVLAVEVRSRMEVRLVCNELGAGRSLHQGSGLNRDLLRERLLNAHKLIVALPERLGEGSRRRGEKLIEGCRNFNPVVTKHLIADAQVAGGPVGQQGDL